MPVPSGYGRSALDYILCLNGMFVAIEAKAPGEWLTPRQREAAIGMLRGGGKVFIISSDEGLNAFKRWVACLTWNPDQSAKFVDNLFRRNLRACLPVDFQN